MNNTDNSVSLINTKTLKINSRPILFNNSTVVSYYGYEDLCYTQIYLVVSGVKNSWSFEDDCPHSLTKSL